MPLKLFHKRHPPVGARPGTLVVASDALQPRMRVIEYDADRIEEREVTTVDEVRQSLGHGRVMWLDVQGLGDEALLRELAALFEIHPLALEDVVNTPQRPKIEAYARHQLLVTRMVRLGDSKDTIAAEQVSVLFGARFVVSFQEHYGDVLDPVRRRLREAVGPIRRSGSDYLAYALLDTIVDGYYPVLERLSDLLGGLEEQMMRRQSPGDLDHLNHLRASLVAMNRSILPHREFLSRLQRDGSPFISAEVLVYLRDTLDHAAQLADVVESDREMANSLLNTYLSLVGMRTNEVMKVLTIMASIFIPLTFLAGIYGMNFEGMPELQERWAYPTLLAVMVVVAAGMLVYFRRKGWIGSDED